MATYRMLCSLCNKPLGTTSDERAIRSLCCQSCAIVEPEPQPPTLAERIALLESDVIKVTTVMVGKGDLLAKDISAAVEAVPNEEPILEEKP